MSKETSATCPICGNKMKSNNNTFMLSCTNKKGHEENGLGYRSYGLTYKEYLEFADKIKKEVDGHKATKTN